MSFLPPGAPGTASPPGVSSSAEGNKGDRVINFELNQMIKAEQSHWMLLLGIATF